MENNNQITFLNVIKHLAFIIIVLCGIYFASDIIVNILISLFITIICWPAMSYMTRHKIPFAIAFILLILIFITFSIILSSILTYSINSFITYLPHITETFKIKFSFLWPYIEKLSLSTIDNNKLLQFSTDISKYGLQFLTTIINSVSSIINYAMIIILTVIFMLFESNNLKRKVILCLNNDINKFNNIKRMLDAIISYISGKFILSLQTAIIIFIILIIFNVKFALMWATLTLLFNFIPNIGSIIISIPIILQVFITKDPITASIITALIILTHFIIGNIIEPKYLGKKVNLSTLVVWLSLLIWGNLLGPIGLILAIPLTSVLKILLELNPNSAKFAYLLSEDINNNKNKNRYYKKNKNYRKKINKPHSAIDKKKNINYSQD